jgi:RecA-family ATPase
MGPVLYLNWETTKEDIDQRVKSVCAGAGIEPVRMYHLLGGGRPLAQRVESVARIIDKTGAVMLVMDSNGKAIGTSGEGPIEDAANRFSSALDELNRSTLCIDHVSKAGAATQGGAGKAYGSTMKTNWARATWEMTQAGKQEDGVSHLVLHHRKHNTTSEHEPIGLAMHWDRGKVWWESEEVTEGALSYGASIADRIAATVAEHPYRAREIADRIGATENAVRAILSRHRERFVKLDTGDWANSGS